MIHRRERRERKELFSYVILATESKEHTEKKGNIK